jgi:ATP-binding cassette subfamily B protein
MKLTTSTAIQSFLGGISPFDRLSDRALNRLANQVTLLRYGMGQAIVLPDALPAQVSILYQGQVRLIGYRSGNELPDTLKRLEPGALLGGISLLRNIPCETAIASTDAVCLTLPASEFRALLRKESEFAIAFTTMAHLSELFLLLDVELQRRAFGEVDLQALVHQVQPKVAVLTVPSGKTPLSQLDPNLLWLLSSGETNRAIASRLDAAEPNATLEVSGDSARLLGIPPFLMELSPAPSPIDKDETEDAIADPFADIPRAPDRPETLDPEIAETKRKVKYPFVSGKGEVNSTLACFQMLCEHWDMPFRKDVVRRTLTEQQRRVGSVPPQLCGALGEMIGLRAQLATVPAEAISRLQMPVMVQWQGDYALIYAATAREFVVAIPAQGLQRMPPSKFAATWGQEGEVLLLQPTKDTPRRKFDLSWFIPSVYKYRRVLTEVLIASFFVQLFGLANPLITQVIIDKVIIQNSAATLNILGSFLIVTAIFEALLTAIRTNLFVETTNRIDMQLGSEVINHLLRLPLPYFEKRPVGELSTRVNELENIRQFLTGTALTVVLDAVFSVIYIAVMIWYSILLTIIALATVPVFAILTLMVAPIIRRQTRVKAERNAETQAYLVEVMSGIQTVKAQNIELPSRWQWQDRYARYMAASFKTVLTSTTAGSFSHFLSQFSNLLLLWVGAYLVLKGELTLGQLIAFRIIAGFATSPLLRLIQLWQNFQETALSLERLSDILDTPQEVSEVDQQNIAMPAIAGAIKYDSVSFRFAKSPTLQLDNVSIEIPAGAFVGVVGQSGAGKSTLTKLLPRLYDPEGGRILVDGYDIHKVELYSLRRQIGMVLQDTLLFDTTVQENIALTNPNATSDEVVAAAQVAFAHDFIMSLSNGYNTRVGERGSALSGGQRQRIAIARTVLQNPRLLILDEATSALDYNSERQVCQNLQEAFKGRTVLFITHRLATIRRADLILMMEKGRVAEQGSHDQLMEMQGLYYCLYQQQEAIGA